MRHTLLVQSRILWPLSVVVAVVVGAVLPLFIHRGYYFSDDTQAGAFGQWYEIGTRLIEGNWSLINPLVWQSGNYLAEGAWGIFSPVLWLVGLGSHVVPSALLFSTGIKVVCLVVGALGTFLLARTFGVSRPWAAAVAVAVPFAGVTFYLDATSWVNGLMAWSMWALAWGLTRRAVFSAKSPTLAILACLGMVGIGYVHATLFLGLALLATIIEAFLSRHRPSIIRSFGISVAAGLFAIVVHLPGLLTVGSSGREKGVVNTGLLTVDLSGLVASNNPIGVAQIGWFGAFFPTAPLLYVSWMLPLFAFVAWRRLIPLLARRMSIVLLLGVSIIGVLLPSDVGPLRIPLRMMPYFAVSLLIILAIGLTLARVEIITRRRFFAACAFVAFSAMLTIFQGPDFAGDVLRTAIIVVLLLWLLYRAGSTRGLPGLKSWPRTAWLMPVIAIAATIGFIYPQHLVHPIGPLLNYQVPGDVRSYTDLLQGAEGDVIVVGGPETGEIQKKDWAESTVANLWYIPDAPVQNAYTSVFYPGYGEVMCMAYQGVTCPELLTTLFTEQPDTDQLLVDDLGVSTILVVKSSTPKKLWSVVPAGWSVIDDTNLTRMLVRDEPVPGAGSVVWEDDETDVTVLDENDMGVTFRVDAVGDDGGQVGLSRISWPGYIVDGGSVSPDLLNDFMMAVDIPASAVGEIVTVEFRAPGYQVQIGAGVLLALLALVWAGVRLYGRLRLRGVALAKVRGWTTELLEPLGQSDSVESHDSFDAPVASPS